MFRDPLIRKAWEVPHQAEHFSVEVLLEAAVWLEEKYHRQVRRARLRWHCNISFLPCAGRKSRQPQPRTTSRGRCAGEKRQSVGPRPSVHCRLW
jgi:hypothetical protein